VDISFLAIYSYLDPGFCPLYHNFVLFFFFFFFFFFFEILQLMKCNASSISFSSPFWKKGQILIIIPCNINMFFFGFWEDQNIIKKYIYLLTEKRKKNPIHLPLKRSKSIGYAKCHNLETIITNKSSKICYRRTIRIYWYLVMFTEKI